MNYRDIEDRLDRQEPQPKLDPGIILLACFGGCALCVLVAACGWKAVCCVGLPLAGIWLLERYFPWRER